MNLETEINRDLWQAIRRSYESQSWSNAILDSIHYLGDVIRSKTDLQSDGTALVGQALGGKTPKLRLSRLQTESERNVQVGVEQLLRGLYQAIRNPRSHERIDDAQADADALIIFVNYLLGVIGHARSSFSVEECVGRIIEENFVPNDRYAELIVQEIPPRQRLQVALAAYRRKVDADGPKLRYFFEAIIPKLDDEEVKELFEAISAELKEDGDERTLKSVLQILMPTHWGKLDEVAKMRTENRVIINLKSGRYSRGSRKCLAGGLATWATAYLGLFTLKRETVDVLLGKLRSSSIESQDYVLQYFFEHLDRLADKPPFTLELILRERLQAGDTRFKEAVDESWLWQDQKWSDETKRAIEGFLPAEPVPDDDDIPF